MACVADPDARNAVSLRAFEKAGFHKVNDFLDPNDGRNSHTHSASSGQSDPNTRRRRRTVASGRHPSIDNDSGRTSAYLRMVRGGKGGDLDAWPVRE
jgi:hypothetical protein